VFCWSLRENCAFNVEDAKKLKINILGEGDHIEELCQMFWKGLLRYNSNGSLVLYKRVSIAKVL
jgi:hypothetical protein